MAVREGTWWSRAWGVIAVLAFALHLGGAAFEAAVLAPIWAAAPPESVTEWAKLAERPDPAVLFHPLVAVIVVASAMAWFSGILTRGWRRWWLTLMLTSAGALAAITVLLVLPCERELFGAGAFGEKASLRGAARTAPVEAAKDPALILALTGDWIRACVLRFVALFVGAWSAYRAQLAGMLADNREAAEVDADEPFVLASEPRPARSPRVRSAREFALGDEEPDLRIADDVPSPRQRWRGSLRGGRRTAKK